MSRLCAACPVVHDHVHETQRFASVGAPRFRRVRAPPSAPLGSVRSCLSAPRTSEIARRSRTRAAVFPLQRRSSPIVVARGDPGADGGSSKRTKESTNARTPGSLRDRVVRDRRIHSRMCIDARGAGDGAGAGGGGGRRGAVPDARARRARRRDRYARRRRDDVHDGPRRRGRDQESRAPDGGDEQPARAAGACLRQAQRRFRLRWGR